MPNFKYQNQASFQEGMPGSPFFLSEVKNGLNYSVEYLKKEAVLLYFKNFVQSFLNAQSRILIYELLNNTRDIRKIKLLDEQIKKRNENLITAEKAITNILEDITDYEKVIKEERDRFRAISSSIGDGLLVLNNHYRIVFINKKAEELLGFPHGLAIGKSVFNVFNVFKGNEKLSREERPLAQAFNKKETVAAEIEDNFYCQVPFSGRKFPVRLIVSPLKGGDISGAVMIFSDLSREKYLEEARMGFISTASHQLRTPLTAIRWYAEILRSDKAGAFSAEQKEFLEQIHSGALRLNEIVNVLLDLARAEGGQVKLHPVKLNIFNFTEELVKGLAPLIKEKNIDVGIEIKPQDLMLMEIFVDKAFLNQIIDNLLSNAVRYTNDSGKIEILIERLGQEIIYSIRDNGIGIPKNQKERVFEKFFRANNAVAKIPDGNGLGLALVKKIVEILGGKIWFESEESQGTTFYFTIPVVGASQSVG